MSSYIRLLDEKFTRFSALGMMLDCPVAVSAPLRAKDRPCNWYGQLTKAVELMPNSKESQQIL